MNRSYGGYEAAIAGHIEKKLEERIRAKEKAIMDVRPIVGDISSMAFDSAEDVYGHALKQRGVNVRQYARSSLRGIVHGMLAEKRLLLGGGSIVGTPLENLGTDRFSVIR